MQWCQKKQLCRKVEYEKFNAVESKRNYLSNFSSSFVSNELKVITNLENQREAGWRQIETGTTKLMAATRKFLLYINTLSEQTYAHQSDRIRETKFYFCLLEVLNNSRMRLIRSQLITGCNWWSYNKQA